MSAIELLEIPEVWTLTPERRQDDRGWFSETFKKQDFPAAARDVEFVQDNQSASASRGTLRGLHFQIPPMAQAKLVRVLKGSILDVVVDIRKSSPTFARHVTLELSASSGKQIFVPEGFAHGFVTLEPHTEVFYKVSGYYSGDHERGLLWCDPDLSIDWKLPREAAIVSQRDRAHPCLRDLPVYFR
ncbi:MAG: dTDP-4-dehydrorhamnose 3,5-epimerase [Proteobacteria bacterium]|nr:dTDP-4-dehydrorhamnose 3,5-epimerase [Pseudomonadota bacterium]